MSVPKFQTGIFVEWKAPLDHIKRSRKRSRKKMETFWFFWLRFRRAYDSAYDSDFWFSLGHKRSYDSAYDSDSVASENQSLPCVLTFEF